MHNPGRNRVGELDWDGQYRFDDAYWTEDGSVIVAKISADKYPAFAFGYDFKDKRVYAIDVNASREQNDRVAESLTQLIIERGGLRPEPLPVRQQAKSVWYWQVR